MNPAIDHIVIGAASLKQGVDYVRRTLGVDIPFGGVHQTMGTHNHLMQLGEGLFLEVIAPNPDLPSPDTPRWYGMDDPHLRCQLENQPMLLTWVINTNNITALLAQADFSFGTIESISRGELNWLFGLPDDGRLLAGGMLPYVMQWNTKTHPAQNMFHAGCELKEIAIYHSHPDWVRSVLSSIGAEKLVNIYPADRDTLSFLEVKIKTPSGLKSLRSHVAAKQ